MRKRIFIILLLCASVPLGYYLYGYAERELEKATERKLEEAAHSMKAKFELGKKYFEGREVRQNYEKARLWYEKAAKKGYVDAQYELGNMYYNGQGVSQDYKKAVYWYEQAATEGYREEDRNIFSLILGGGPTKEYVKGNVIAQYTLGVMYEQGLGIRQDYAKAHLWYKKAAEQGHMDALINLALLYKHGYGVYRNIHAAREWFGIACDRGVQRGCDEYARAGR